MTHTDSTAPDDVLRHGLSLIVGATAEEQAERLAATLAPLRDQPVRLVRVANPLQAKLSLKRILIQVGRAETTGTTDAAQIMQSLIQALSARHGNEDHVLLIIEQAETLEPEAALSLQTLAATLNDGVPALHVLLVGSPAIMELGISAAAPLGSPVNALATEAADLDTGPPMSKPLTWRRTLARAGLAAAPLGLILAWTYSGLRLPPRAASVAPMPAESSSRPAPRSLPPPEVEQAVATPIPAPTAPPAIESEQARRMRLRADFDQFLASSGRTTARLTRVQRDALFQEYLTWRARQPSGRSY